MGISLNLMHGLIAVTTMWATLTAYYLLSTERPDITATAKIWLTVVTVWVFIVAGAMHGIEPIGKP